MTIHYYLEVKEEGKGKYKTTSFSPSLSCMTRLAEKPYYRKLNLRTVEVIRRTVIIRKAEK